MLVMVSWVSFWLDPTAMEARVSLGVTTILTIVTQTYGINQSAPPASYVKALDVWTAACLAMVFGALLQFALVSYLCRPVEQKEAPKFEDGERKPKKKSRSKRIDIVSRFLFPIVFILFNLTYWLAYLLPMAGYGI